IRYSDKEMITIAKHPESKPHSVGEDAEFEVIANGSGPLSYQWQKNGEAIDGATASKLVYPAVTLADNLSEFTCRVFNQEGEAIISEPAVLQVTTNRRPQVFITVPELNSFYNAGDTVVIRGHAIDEETGGLPVQFLSWKIDFY